MPPSARNRRSERARTSILAATAELIREQPYAAVTIEGIAARAGVGKQTIYRWWPSKGSVVVEALAEQNASDPGQTLALPDTGDLAADMRAVLRAIVDEFHSPESEPLLRALLIESLQDASLRQQIVDRIFMPQFHYVQRRFEAARSSGQFRDDVEQIVAFELFIAPLFHRWVHGTLPLTHKYADAVADLAMRAIHPADRAAPG